MSKQRRGVSRTPNVKVSGLLTRQQFKELVFSRDRSLCVVCGAEAKYVFTLLDKKPIDQMIWSEIRPRGDEDA